MLRLKGWIAAVAADPAAMLFVVAVVLLIAILVGMAFAARARRRDDHSDRVEAALESSGPVAIAPPENFHMRPMVNAIVAALG